MIVFRMLGPSDDAILDQVAEGVFDHVVDPALAAEFLADPRHHLAVALDGEVVVGMASALHYIHPDKPPELWVNEVGVAPEQQRRGVGLGLLRALLAHGRALGCTQAWVLTDRENAAARGLYAASGGIEASDSVVMVEFDLRSGS
ncbi:MAG: GNAT family N-acetyltransferase [Oscillochloris sp.]|nr:GNAT family N-acetyltransferase [Oscillochloris sp.]